MVVAGFPRRPGGYQAAAPRPAIPGNGVNLSLLITPTRIPLGVSVPPTRIFPVELTQYSEISPGAWPWNWYTPRTAVGFPVVVEYRMNPVVVFAAIRVRRVTADGRGAVR